MLRRMARDNLSRRIARRRRETRERHIPREKKQQLRQGERLRGRVSEFELLKPNEQSIPCQLAKGCQERTRPDQDKRNDLAAQSATSSSTGGLHERSLPNYYVLCLWERILGLSVRARLTERNTTRDTKHRPNLFTVRPWCVIQELHVGRSTTLNSMLDFLLTKRYFSRKKKRKDCSGCLVANYRSMLFDTR